MGRAAGLDPQRWSSSPDYADRCESPGRPGDRVNLPAGRMAVGTRLGASGRSDDISRGPAATARYRGPGTGRRRARPARSRVRLPS